MYCMRHASVTECTRHSSETFGIFQARLTTGNLNVYLTALFPKICRSFVVSAAHCGRVTGHSEIICQTKPP